MNDKKVNLENDAEVSDLLKQVESDMDKSAPESLDVRVHVRATMINNEIKNVAVTTSADSPEKRFIALSKMKEDLNEQYKKLNEDLEAVMEQLGEGKMFQDPETMLVYQIVKPKGKYVMFSDLDYVRTKTLEEDKGDLSFAKAEEAGFDVSSLKKPKGKKS
jgi:hypothetical protein